MFVKATSCYRQVKRFDDTGLGGVELYQKTLGVIGAGRIGRHSLRIGQGFGMKVVAFDVVQNESRAAELGFSYLPFNELLAISDFITVFVSIKNFLYDILKKIKPKAVLIRCGYGRFPMALSQACKELGIPPIELQHGLITAYLPAYRRATPTTNKDCIPEYLLAHGNHRAPVKREFGNVLARVGVRCRKTSRQAAVKLLPAVGLDYASKNRTPGGQL